jgi:transcriptional regulator with XRE-family HTH domain
MSKSETLIRLGQRIRELREGHNITQEQLGFASGLDRTYISDLERGNRNPSVLGLEKLAIGFGITISELLEGVDGRQNNQKKRR